MHQWTEDERQFVINNYKTLGPAAIAAKLEITVHQVEYEAGKHGLIHKGKHVNYPRTRHQRQFPQEIRDKLGFGDIYRDDFRVIG